MTDLYMFDDADLQDKVKELKKELKQIKDDKFRGELDLEKQIDILKTQLILKAVITEEDWHTLRDFIAYDFLQDGHFAELKESEMLLERIRLANEVRDYVGKYYSVEYVRKNILKQSDRDIEDINTQIKKEIDDGIISAPTEDIPGSGGNL